MESLSESEDELNAQIVERIDLRRYANIRNQDEYIPIVIDYFQLACDEFHHLFPAQAREDKGKLSALTAVFLIEDYHCATKLKINKRALFTMLPSAGIALFSAVPFYKMASKLTTNPFWSKTFGSVSFGFNAGINYHYSKELADDKLQCIVSPVRKKDIINAYKFLEEFPEDNCKICLHYTGKTITDVVLLGLAVSFSFYMFAIDLKENNASIPSAAVFWTTCTVLNYFGVSGIHSASKTKIFKFAKWTLQKPLPYYWEQERVLHDIRLLKRALIGVMESAKSNIVSLIQQGRDEELGAMFAALDQLIELNESVNSTHNERMHHVLHLILLINSFSDEKFHVSKGEMPAKVLSVILIGGISCVGWYLASVDGTKHYFDTFTTHPMNWGQAYGAGSFFFIGMAGLTVIATANMSGKIWRAGAYASHGIAQSWRESESVGSFFLNGLKGIFNTQTMHRVVRLDLASVQNPSLAIPIVSLAWALSPFTSATSLMLNRTTLQPYIGLWWHAFTPSTVAECMLFNALPFEEIAVKLQRQWVALGSDEKKRKQLRLIKFIEKRVGMLQRMTETRFIEYLHAFAADNPHRFTGEDEDLDNNLPMRKEFINHLYNNWSTQTIFGKDHQYSDLNLTDAIVDLKTRNDELKSHGMFKANRRRNLAKEGEDIPLINVNNDLIVEDEDDLLGRGYQSQINM